MNAASPKYQGGYVLLLTLLAFMGVGGVVLAGFTQQAKQEREVQRYQHNQQVLEQAKQALLMFAYNYPQTNDAGPGRLPCPDHDNDGLIGVANCALVGRLPWNDPRLGVPQLRDATGETLWYAASGAFGNAGGGGVINSDTLGSNDLITLIDRSGNVLYDGAVAGIAGVVIAPGSITRRDEDANGSYEFLQLRNTVAQRIDPRNYLDTFNGFDNSVFNSGESDTNDDGFILGPVYDLNRSDIVVNDQLIIITAAEVIEMAHKSVLDNYKIALDEYQQNLWGPTVANYRYPWLQDYADITDLNLYDLVPALTDTVGRMPYLNYYQDHDSHIIETDLQISYDMSWNLADNNDINDPNYVNAFVTAGIGYGLQVFNTTDSRVSFQKVTFDGLTDVSTDFVGTMVVEAVGAPTTVVNTQRTLYFWDGCASCPEPEDGWEVCPVSSGNEEDCAKDDAFPYNFEAYTDWLDHADIKIRVVTLQWDIDDEFILEFDYTAPPLVSAYAVPVGGGTPQNATFTADLGPQMTELTVDINNFTGVEDREFVNVTITFCEQDDLVGGAFNIPSSNPDGNSLTCVIDLASTAVNVFSFNITADYFPELPLWVSDNNWNSSILMAYANDYRPGGGQDCMVTAPCLTVNRVYSPVATANVMLLAGAGTIPVNAGDLNTPSNIFEGENGTPLDATFDARPDPGNDIVVVYDEI